MTDPVARQGLLLTWFSGLSLKKLHASKGRPLERRRSQCNVRIRYPTVQVACRDGRDAFYFWRRVFTETGMARATSGVTAR